MEARVLKSCLNPTFCHGLCNLFKLFLFHLVFYKEQDLVILSHNMPQHIHVKARCSSAKPRFLRMPRFFLSRFSKVKLQRLQHVLIKHFPKSPKILNNLLNNFKDFKVSCFAKRGHKSLIPNSSKNEASDGKCPSSQNRGLSNL